MALCSYEELGSYDIGAELVALCVSAGMGVWRRVWVANFSHAVPKKWSFDRAGGQERLFAC